MATDKISEPDGNRFGLVRHIGMISNPHSGRNRKLLPKIEAIVAEHPTVHHVSTQNPAELPDVLASFAAQKVDIIAINGGDGTVAEVFTHLLENSPFEHLPVVALLPGGTTNMNTGDIGLRGKLIPALKRLCSWSAEGRQNYRLKKRPVLKVKYSKDANAVYGMFFGAGAIIQGIEYSHSNVHSSRFDNEIGPGIAIARTLWGIIRNDPRFTRTVSAGIAINDAPRETQQDILVVLVSSLERLFMGMRPYWGNESGSLHASIIRAQPEKFMRALPSVLRGRPNRHVTQEAGYRSHNINQLSLQMTGTFTLDGEMYHANESNGPVIVSNGGEITFIRL